MEHQEKRPRMAKAQAQPSPAQSPPIKSLRKAGYSKEADIFSNGKSKWNPDNQRAMVGPDDDP